MGAGGIREFGIRECGNTGWEVWEYGMWAAGIGALEFGNTGCEIPGIWTLEFLEFPEDFPGNQMIFLGIG